jgi:hypothetical protein
MGAHRIDGAANHARSVCRRLPVVEASKDGTHPHRDRPNIPDDFLHREVHDPKPRATQPLIPASVSCAAGGMDTAARPVATPGVGPSAAPRRRSMLDTREATLGGFLHGVWRARCAVPRSSAPRRATPVAPLRSYVRMRAVA